MKYTNHQYMTKISISYKRIGESQATQHFQWKQKLILEHSDEIMNVILSSDPVDKSKSTCLLRFRTVSGENE